MQVQQKHTHIQSFGGLNFVNGYLTQGGFESLATEQLGERNILARYSYGQLIRQLFFISLMGGDTLDESGVLKEQLKDHPGLHISSADTIEYAFQELCQKTKKVSTKGGIQHQINEHAGFNKLLPILCSRLGLLSAEDNYMMDYDGHIVENTKHDNAFTYKKTEGYYPVICSINKLPVYMQNRNGNTPESYGQMKIIEKAFNQCRENNITVDSFRADACCYEKKTIQYLESEQVTYYIRAEKSQRIMDALIDEPDWEPATLGYRNVEVCSIEEKIFGQNKCRRIVAYRYKPSGQLSIEDVDGYRYYTIVTSDAKHTALQCIEIYNQRGCYGEHHFKELDYDFGWNKLPFGSMEMNTIYMYAMAIAYLLFNAVKTAYSKKLGFVKSEMRLKNFVLHFVTLPAKWIKTGRRWVLKIFTKKIYSPLWSP